MDLDVAQVRAFVRVADRRHFGRAAEDLYLTQQALSKRVKRLETTLNTRLLLREHQVVELTDAGRAFLPHARTLLDAADAASAAVGNLPERSLRLDVWGAVQAPLRLVRRLTSQSPDLLIEVSMRRSLHSAVAAIRRGELDAAFGRACTEDGEWSADLHRRVACLEPLGVAVSAAHPLAGKAMVTTDDLRAAGGLWWPGEKGSPELVGLLRAYCTQFGIPLRTEGLNLGLEHALAAVRDDPCRALPVGTEWALPHSAEVTVRALEPTPYYPWSLIWPRQQPHPELGRFLRQLTGMAAHEGRLHLRSGAGWLPPPT
jgi:DNA-binding transcriptional LysR family regulator